jgi:hypothetical protein
MTPEKLTFAEFAKRYCERQQNEPSELLKILQDQKVRYQPTGWMLLEAQLLDSSYMGSLVILPYGPNNTYKEPPTHPVSPRGLASDMSVVVAVLPSEDLPDG